MASTWLARVNNSLAPDDTRVVIFLCRAEEAQTRRVLEKLCRVSLSAHEGETASEEGGPTKLAAVPWLPAHDPPADSIRSLVSQVVASVSQETSMIFVDRRCLVEEVCFIVNWHHGLPEAATVPMEGAFRKLLAASRKSLGVVLPSFDQARYGLISPRESLKAGKEDPSTESHDSAIRHVASARVNMNASTLTLISLLHLSPQDLEQVRAQIGTSEDMQHVDIINWPENEEPCSRAQLYRLFDALKPAGPHFEDRATLLFLDSDDESDTGLGVMVATQRSTGSESPCLVLSRLDESSEALDFWRALWGPDCDGILNTAEECELVPDPCRLRFSLNCTVFFLTKVTKTQFCEIREMIDPSHNRVLEFVDVSSHLQTPDMQGLMAYLTSSAYLASGSEQPPHVFLAIDRQTLDNLSSERDDPSVLLASLHALSISIQTSPIERYWAWLPGCAYGRVDGYEDALEAWMNLDMANSSFVDVIQNPQYLCTGAFEEWGRENADLVSASLGEVEISPIRHGF